MPKYVVLTKLTDEGRETIKDNPERIREVNQEIKEMGGEIISQYTLLGEYDFINIIEVPDTETLLKISVYMGERGTVEPMSMEAIEIDKLISALKE